MTNQEKLRAIVEKCTEHMRELLKTRIPTQGKQAGARVWFEYPGKNYRGIFEIQYDFLSEDQTGRRIRVSMGEMDSDKIVSHYMTKGTNQELIDWLALPENIDELIDSYQSLEKSVDNFD